MSSHETLIKQLFYDESASVAPFLLKITKFFHSIPRRIIIPANLKEILTSRGVFDRVSKDIGWLR